MLIDLTGIEGVIKLTPRRFEDRRGSFTEMWNPLTFAQVGITASFVQDNCSISTDANTIRGLHMQIGEAAQAKLVRPVRGQIIDVVVDLRPTSVTYGRWLTICLDARSGEQVFVPAGLAHGFRTCTPDTEVHYKVSSYYAPHHERGIHWRDADLAIDWGINDDQAVLSDRDEVLPSMTMLLEELAQPMPAFIGPLQTDTSALDQ